MLAHKAMKEGEVVAEIIAGHPSGKDWVTIPSIVFTDPEIASVGPSEEAVKAAGTKYRAGSFPSRRSGER